jgi:NADPH-dependent 2,4-dienoyl-CoA reductase/sulfur reductase-like enzyme
VQGQHLRQREAPSAARTSRVNMAMNGQGSRVVIVGGGFGGLYTALNLAKLAPLQEEAKAKPDITLIDTSDR